MSKYIDGFVHPISKNYLDQYKLVAEAVAEIWQEHGAIDYQEYIGDDLSLEGTASFPDCLNLSDSEVALFGWVSFESRQARDLANKKVAADPRIDKLLNAAHTSFDARRMMYGGFECLVNNGN